MRGINLVLRSTASATIEIFLNPAPKISIQPASLALALGSGETLTASGGVYYTWSPADGLSCSSCNNPFAKPTKNTTYVVMGIDANHCKSTDTVIVKLLCSELFVPDAFSPNGDGKNDSLYVRSRCIDKLIKFEIYNRWGQKIFENSDISKGWDGTFKNEKLDPDVFFYFLEATLQVGGNLKAQGNLSLVR